MSEPDDTERRSRIFQPEEVMALNKLKGIEITVLTGPLAGKKAQAASYKDASELLLHVAQTAEKVQVGFDASWEGGDALAYTGKLTLPADCGEKGYDLGRHIQKFLAQVVIGKNRGGVSLDTKTYNKFRNIQTTCAMADEPPPAVAADAVYMTLAEMRVARFMKLPEMPADAERSEGPFFWETP